MSQLSYMTKRGAGVVLMGTAEELGRRMMKLRASATLRSDYGAEIGRSLACDGTCDGQCRGWHVFYDPTGDACLPDPVDDEPEDAR